jgi:hypothetical protein
MLAFHRAYRDAAQLCRKLRHNCPMYARRDDSGEKCSMRKLQWSADLSVKVRVDYALHGDRKISDCRAEAVYRRFREKGRMTPDGLKYIDSWVEANFGRCFQLMECDDVGLLQQWVARWQDLIEFEIVPVAQSKVASEAIGPLLSS